MTGNRHQGHRVRIAGAVTLSVLAVAGAAACSDEADDATPTTAVQNFTGSGSAELVLDDQTTPFTVACESTGSGDEAQLLISGRPADPATEAVGLEVRILLEERSGSVGANLGGDDPVPLTDSDVAFSAEGDTWQADVELVGDAGGEPRDGSLTVSGCVPPGA